MCTGIFKNEDFSSFFLVFFPSWMGRKILPSSLHFHSRAGIWLEKIGKKKKNGDREEGDLGQGCFSQIPGNPSWLPALLGWNWAGLEQEGPCGGTEELGILPGLPREGGIPWLEFQGWLQWESFPFFVQ